MIGLAICTLVSATIGPRLARAQQQATSAPPLVFDQVTVVDVQQGRLLPAQRVVIVGNRIQAVGSVSTVPMPAGARIVKAEDKYLIPGLWDFHTHPRRYTDFFYPVFIANGVTGIRDGWSEVPLDTLLQWRREILAGTRVGPPRQFLPGPALDEAQPCHRDNSGHVCVADAADARHVVDSLKAAGADYIQTSDLGRAMYFVVAAEARRVGLPFGGDLTTASAMEASDSGARFLDHIRTAGGLDTLCLDGRGASVERCRAVVEAFRHNNTWWVPALARNWVGDMQEQERPLPPQPGPRAQAIYDRFNKGDGVLEDLWQGIVPPHRNWLHPPGDSVGGPGSARDTVGFLHLAHQAQLPIVAGTDAGAPMMKADPPGFALHLELAMYVAEGLTPLEALQAATINPAQLLHATDSLGTVAPGKLADLVLLNANPLTDITNTTAIHAVVANGRYFDRAALDQLLTHTLAAAKTEPQPLGDAR